MERRARRGWRRGRGDGRRGRRTGWEARATTHPAAASDDGAEPAVPPAPPFARLRIERIGLQVFVVEGIDAAALRRGPGHLPGTVGPGESGNCGIASHRDGWFARLHD